LSLLYLTTTQVYVLINYTAFIESLAVAASVGALLWLRYKQPNLERPIKVNLILPIIFFITCVFLVLLPFYVSPYETGIGIAITASGVPIYLLTVHWKSKPRLYRKLISKLSFDLCRILSCLIFHRFLHIAYSKIAFLYSRRLALSIWSSFTFSVLWVQIY